MSFIAVKDIRFQTHCNQSSDTTYPQDQFLSQPVFIVAAIEIMCNSSVFRQIVIKISIKKNKPDFSHHCFHPMSSVCPGHTRLTYR